MRKILLYISLILLLSLSACTAPPEIPPAAEIITVSQPPPMPEQEPIIADETGDPPPPKNEPSPSPAAQEIPAYNNYNVSLEIEPRSRTMRGIERVTFTNRTGVELETVVMRIYLNAFDEGFKPSPFFNSFENRIFLSGKDYGSIDIRGVTVESGDAEYKLEGTVLTVTLPEILLPDETVQIGLQFEAYIPKIAHRTGANENAMWCGMFLPVLAVYGEDGWRTDPYYPAGDPFVLETANYNVEITTPPEYIVAGSGVKKEDVFDNNKVTTFSAKMTRDFAFAVSDKFQIAEISTASGVTVQYYYYTEDANVDGVLDAAKRSMDYFESAVGTYPFPSGHVCIVETDMFVSAMEFSKVIFMDAARLKREGDYHSLTHAIGHQWFFNVVGSDQIREAWLDEAMTLYVQERFAHDTEGEFHEKMSGEYKLFVAEEGQRLSDGTDVYESWDDYYAVQCTKGKLMFYALNRLMGDEKFEQCIQKYYQTYSFKIASGADFIAIANEVYGDGTGQGSLTGFFDEWLNGEKLPKLIK